MPGACPWGCGSAQASCQDGCCVSLALLVLAFPPFAATGAARPPAVAREPDRTRESVPVPRARHQDARERGRLLCHYAASLTPTVLLCRPLLSELAHHLLVRVDLLRRFLLALPFGTSPLLTQCGARLTDATGPPLCFSNGPSADQRASAWIVPLPHRESETRFCGDLPPVGSLDLK